MVYMVVDLYGFQIGVCGPPCSHHFVLCAHKLISSKWFPPVFSQFERQKFAKIVCGENFETNFFDPLHATEIEDIDKIRKKRLQ